MKIIKIVQRIQKRIQTNDKKRKMMVFFLLFAGLCTACGNAGIEQTEPVIETTTSVEKETETISESKSETKAIATESSLASESVQNESGKTMQEIYEEIEKTVEQPEMIVLNDNYIANYYGIDLSLLEDYFFASAQEVIYADMIILMKVKEESSVQTVKDALDTMIAQKKLELENYLPEQFQIVEKSEVVVSGNYVYLVISEKAEEIQAVITEYFN